jgi:hypothetical protein
MLVPTYIIATVKLVAGHMEKRVLERIRSWAWIDNWTILLMGTFD